MEKVELARRQLDGAIRARLRRDDPVIAATLTFPASQLLRDLNIGNPASISGVLTELAEESGYRAGLLWSEFNKNSGANDFKHARDSKTFECADAILSDVDGAIMFALCEYMILNKVTVSHHIAAFGMYKIREGKRAKRGVLFADIRNRIDRCAVLNVADTKVAFYKGLLTMLEFIRDRVLPRVFRSASG